MLGEIEPAARDRLAQLVELEPARRGRARGGVAAHLIDDETEIDEAWLDGVETVGVTSGASAPEKLVDARVRLVPRARRRRRSQPYRLVDEDVEFRLPVELRRELALAESQS